MRELSLFTGAGGGLLGTHLLGWEPCGYVEWNKYCQQVIAARIKDGFLPVAPIFTDVREFVQSGAARQYRGIADVVSAGFPCQPFSVAGKQAGADDERNMWPATRDVIRDVQPESVLLENVRGLISAGYLGTVIGDLADLGYVGRWGIIRASDVGAPHERARLWIVAHSERARLERSWNVCLPGQIRATAEKRASVVVSESGEASKVLADADKPAIGDEFKNIRAPGNEINKSEHSSGAGHGACLSDNWIGYSTENMAHADAARRQEQHTAAESDRSGSSARRAVSWWLRDPADAAQSPVGRVAYGVADRVDRLTALGNGQVPAVARTAWELLA